jgi:hypothetical protein
MVQHKTQSTYNHVVLLQPDPDPRIALTPDIKESSAIPDVSYLFVLVQVLVEEHLDLLLVDVAHLLWRHSDYVAVLVASLESKLVDICNIGESIVEDSQLFKVFLRNLSTGVVEFPLVDTLRAVSLVILL